METITFNCKVITPMFLAGADGRTPELRAPSIKGAMRFWWRACNGHLVEEKDGKWDYSKLKEEEGKIFGDTKRRSSFSIHLKTHPNHILKNPWELINYETKRGGKRSYNVPKEDSEGIHFLYYSVFMNERPCFFPSNKNNFEIEIILQNPDYKDEIVYVFNTINFLGGIGTRSRRMAGKVLFINNDIKLEGVFSEGDLQKKLKNHFSKFTYEKSRNLSYSNLHSSSFCILPPKKKWYEAVESLGRKFKEFRNSNQNRVSDTPNFGFPILHRSMTTTMVGGFKRNNKPSLLERRSSPLIFQTVYSPEKGGLYFPIICHLSGDFMPEDFEIMDKKGNNAKAPSTQIIQEFLDSIDKKTVFQL